MNIKEHFEVIENVPFSIAKSIVEKFHYSRVLPCGSKFIYGLKNKNTHEIVGICVFGSSANFRNNSFCNIPMIELTRLVLLENNVDNLLSFFVAQCLKIIPFEGYIISYADSYYNHCGYIYQATNWLYTGKTSNISAFINLDDKETKIYHRKTLYEKFKTSHIDVVSKYNYKMIYIKYKYRYFYIKANSKKKKKELLQLLQQKYTILPYPKKQNVYYDNNSDNIKSLPKVLF